MWLSRPRCTRPCKNFPKKTGVVRAFQTALLAFEAHQPSEKYPEEVQAVIDAFKRQADFLHGSAELWDSMAICSNAEVRLFILPKQEKTNDEP